MGPEKCRNLSYGQIQFEPWRHGVPMYGQATNTELLAEKLVKISPVILCIDGVPIPNDKGEINYFDPRLRLP